MKVENVKLALEDYKTTLFENEIKFNKHKKNNDFLKFQEDVNNLNEDNSINFELKHLTLGLMDTIKHIQSLSIPDLIKIKTFTKEIENKELMDAAIDEQIKRFVAFTTIKEDAIKESNSVENFLGKICGLKKMFYKEEQNSKVYSIGYSNPIMLEFNHENKSEYDYNNSRINEINESEYKLVSDTHDVLFNISGEYNIINKNNKNNKNLKNKLI